jgi:Protein of unknown function (DUF998)
MEVRNVTEGAAHALEGRRSVIATLAAAGIAGPLLFTVVAVVHSLLRSDHSLVALPISALAVRPSGWVQNLNFVICGLLFLANPIHSRDPTPMSVPDSDMLPSSNFLTSS